MRELLAILMMLAAGCSQAANDCGGLRQSFSEFRTAAAQSKNVATYFSRPYLEEQINSLTLQDDDLLLPNAKVVRKLLVFPEMLRDDYTLSYQCSAHSGAVILNFPNGIPGTHTLRTLTLKYIREHGAWQIAGSEFLISGNGT
jgi:hypothetical protein